MSIRARYKLFELFLWLCLVTAFLIASYVIFHEYRFSLNTDGAAEDVLAKLAFAEGHLIPKNWTYANGDLWILGPRLFLIIALPWLGFGYLLHASATWLAYIYLLLMVYGTCRVIAPSRPRAAIIATALAAGCLSTLNFEFVVGQGAYSLYAALALAIFGMVSRPPTTEASRQSRTLTWLLVGLAAALVCISNATRGNITIIVPLVAGWVSAIIFHPGNQWRERVKNFNSPIVFSVIVGAVAGTLLYKYWLLPSVANSGGAASLKLIPVSEMLRRLSILPSAWFIYFRIGGAWESLSLVLRIAQCFAWLISIGLLLAPLLVVARPKHHAPASVTMSWIALACYAVTFTALVASKNLFNGPASLRYATFAIYASICVIAILVDRAAKWRPRASVVLATLICLVSIWTISTWREEWTPGGVTYDERIALIASLEQHDVSMALTTYWNSQVLSVLSNGKVEVLPVDLNETTGLQRHAQNSPRIVLSIPANDKQAIALTHIETPATLWKKLDNEFGEPVQRYQSGPFTVAVYDRRIVQLVYGNNIAKNEVVPDQLMIRLSRAELSPCKSTQPCRFMIEVTNTGQHVLATAGTKPLRLGIHGIDAQGNVIKWDAGRADFPLPLYPGDSTRIGVNIPPSSNPKIVGYRLCLLQELVAWHCDRTKVTPHARTLNFSP